MTLEAMSRYQHAHMTTDLHLLFTSFHSRLRDLCFRHGALQFFAALRMVRHCLQFAPASNLDVRHSHREPNGLVSIVCLRARWRNLRVLLPTLPDEERRLGA